MHECCTLGKIKVTTRTEEKPYTLNHRKLQRLQMHMEVEKKREEVLAKTTKQLYLNIKTRDSEVRGRGDRSGSLCKNTGLFLLLLLCSTDPQTHLAVCPWTRRTKTHIERKLASLINGAKREKKAIHFQKFEFRPTYLTTY